MKRGRPKGSKNKKSLETIVMDKAIESQSSIASKMESIEYKTLKKVHELEFLLDSIDDKIIFCCFFVSIYLVLSVILHFFKN